jgi:hypothetical protein
VHRSAAMSVPQLGIVAGQGGNDQKQDVIDAA